MEDDWRPIDPEWDALPIEDKLNIFMDDNNYSWWSRLLVIVSFYYGRLLRRW